MYPRLWDAAYHGRFSFDNQNKWNKHFPWENFMRESSSTSYFTMFANGCLQTLFFMRICVGQGWKTYWSKSHEKFPFVDELQVPLCLWAFPTLLKFKLKLKKSSSFNYPKTNRWNLQFDWNISNHSCLSSPEFKIRPQVEINQVDNMSKGQLNHPLHSISLGDDSSGVGFKLNSSHFNMTLGPYQTLALRLMRTERI